MHFALSVRRFGVADLYGLFRNLKERNVHALVKDLQKAVKEFADSAAVAAGFVAAGLAAGLAAVGLAAGLAADSVVP